MIKKDPLQLANEALDAAIRERKQAQDLIKTLGPAVLESMRPLLEEIARNSKTSKDDLLSAIKEIKIEVPETKVPEANVKFNIPEIKVPEPKVTVNVAPAKVTIPEIKLPTINIPRPEVTINPKFNMPEIVFPEEMAVRGWVGFMGYDKSMLSNPLPVQLRDADGNPMKLFENLKAIVGGQGGGGFPMRVLDEANNALRVSGSFSISASNSSTQAIDSSGNAYSVDNPMPVQVVSGGTATTGVNLLDSSGIGYSGSNPVPVQLVSGGGATTASANVDSSGAQYSGSNPFPMYLAQGSNNTVGVAPVDSTGAEYSGSNPFPVTLISGALTSTVSVGPTAQGSADDGSNPLKGGGIGRTTLPAGVSDGQMVGASFDKIGRQLVQYQARALTQSAYVAVSTGTETQLVAGVAATFLDLVWITAANNSDAAVSIDIRSGTAGSVLLTLQVPASGTAGISMPASPLQQEILAGAWTVDMPDITGTTVSVSAKFSKEI